MCRTRWMYRAFNVYPQPTYPPTFTALLGTTFIIIIELQRIRIFPFLRNFQLHLCLTCWCFPPTSNYTLACGSSQWYPFHHFKLLRFTRNFHIRTVCFSRSIRACVHVRRTNLISKWVSSNTIFRCYAFAVELCHQYIVSQNSPNGEPVDRVNWTLASFN